MDVAVQQLFSARKLSCDSLWIKFSCFGWITISRLLVTTLKPSHSGFSCLSFNCFSSYFSSQHYCAVYWTEPLVMLGPYSLFNFSQRWEKQKPEKIYKQQAQWAPPNPVTMIKRKNKLCLGVLKQSGSHRFKIQMIWILKTQCRYLI